MKISFAVLLLCGVLCIAFAQDKPTTMTASLNKSLGIFVFPA